MVSFIVYNTSNFETCTSDVYVIESALFKPTHIWLLLGFTVPLLIMYNQLGCCWLVLFVNLCFLLFIIFLFGV